MARQVEMMFRRIFKIISHLSAKSGQENARARMSGSAVAMQRVRGTNERKERVRREGASERGQFKVGHKFVRQMNIQIKIKIHLPTE